MLTQIALASIFLLSVKIIHSVCCFPGPSICAPCGETDRRCCIGICDGYPYLLTRPQGRNAARDLVGEQKFVHKYGDEERYSTASITVEYQQSFWPDQIARFLFGSDFVNCCNLFIQGSLVQNRHPKAWLADYFGLPMDFDSKIKFCPKIQNAIIDINIYTGLDNLAKGLYAKFDFPIAWTKWELNPCEKICNRGTEPFPAGYMSEEEIPREQLSSSFLQYMKCGKRFGDMKELLHYGRICRGALKKIRLAEIRGSLGYNFVLDRDYHFGFFVQLSAPTGNRRCSKYLFEPIVGNGKHWEIGGGISGSWIFHRSKENESKYVGVWLDATITHLCTTRQCRSFDFTCKPNSRYMLLEEMGTNKNNIQGKVDQTLTEATYQYKKDLVPAINWSTFKVDVRMDIQADIAVKLGFVKDGWSFDLGYNFWAMTGEKFELDCCTCELFYDYAVKGDAHLYGKDPQTTMYPISATQSLADIHSGKNYPAQPLTDNTEQNDLPTENPRIDNPKQAFVGTIALSSISTTTLKTSIQPVFLEKRDLNLGDSPTAMTHKIFAYIGYTPIDREKYWTPFIGLGGQVEFAKNRCKTCCDKCSNKCCPEVCKPCGCSLCCNNDETCCYTCDDCCDLSCNKKGGVSQWGIWLKCGLHFE